jgi:hypothetical protein
VFAGAVLVAAPLAALTVKPATPNTLKAAPTRFAASEPHSATSAAVADEPTDLPSIIAQGVSSSVTTAVAAASNVAPRAVKAPAPDFRVEAPSGASVERAHGLTVSRSPNGATVTVYPPDAQGRRKIVALAPNGATAVAYANADEDIPGITARAERRRTRDPVIDQIIEMKAVGVTPQYVAQMRSASPRMRGASLDDIVGMRAVGVTPEYIGSMAAAGLGNLSADELTQARAVGVSPDYVRSMVVAGFRGTLDDYIEMRAVGVTPEYAAEFRRSGYPGLGAKQLIKLKVHGVNADALRTTPRPPNPPRPPGNPDDADGG